MTEGVILQISFSHGLGLIVAGRLVAGLGVGFESAIVILYMSEICPRKVRGALVAGYQFCITIGIMLASIVDYAVRNRTDTGAYRIPIGIQFAWGIILGGGLLFLPDSPRFFIKRGRVEKARQALCKLRGQPPESEYVEAELAEIIANEEYERSLIPAGSWLNGWMNCFRGSVFKSNSNLRKTILGTSLQMMQQWTGVNFIFYYSTPFLASTGAISNTFLISLIFTLVNVCSTPISFYTVEKFGRRTILLWGALGMLICQFLVAIIGDTVGFNHTHTVGTGANAKSIANNISAVNAQVAFIAIFIFFFASTWGPGAWIVIGEIFPLPIRSRGVGLSTASNWLWNTIIAVITPYMVGPTQGNLRSNVFFVWGGLCTCAFVYSYFLIPETKVSSLISHIQEPLLTHNTGPLARASRQDDGGDQPTYLLQVAPNHHLRFRDGSQGGLQALHRCHRRRRAQGLDLLVDLSIGRVCEYLRLLRLSNFVGAVRGTTTLACEQVCYIISAGLYERHGHISACLMSCIA